MEKMTLNGNFKCNVGKSYECVCSAVGKENCPRVTLQRKSVISASLVPKSYKIKTCNITDQSCILRWVKTHCSISSSIISQSGLPVLFAFQVNVYLSAAVHVEIAALIAGDTPEINRDDGSLWRGWSEKRLALFSGQKEWNKLPSHYFWALLELPDMHKLSCMTDVWWLMLAVNISWHFKASSSTKLWRSPSRLCQKIMDFCFAGKCNGESVSADPGH